MLCQRRFSGASEFKFVSQSAATVVWIDKGFYGGVALKIEIK